MSTTSAHRSSTRTLAQRARLARRRRDSERRLELDLDRRVFLTPKGEAALDEAMRGGLLGSSLPAFVWMAEEWAAEERERELDALDEAKAAHEAAEDAQQPAPFVDEAPAPLAAGRGCGHVPRPGYCAGCLLTLADDDLELAQAAWRKQTGGAR